MITLNINSGFQTELKKCTHIRGIQGHIYQLLNISTLLGNKEKELLKGNSKKQIKTHCHLTGYLHAQRPLGLRQHEKWTGVIEIWLVILVK